MWDWMRRWLGRLCRLLKKWKWSSSSWKELSSRLVGHYTAPVAMHALHLISTERGPGSSKGSDCPAKTGTMSWRTGDGRCGFDSHCRSRGEEGGCSATGSRPSTGRDTHLEPFQLATPCNAMHAAFMAAIRDWGPTIRRRNFVLIGLSFDGGTARFLQPWRLFSGSLTGQNTEASRSRPRLSFVNHFPDPDMWEPGRLTLNDN